MNEPIHSFAPVAGEKPFVLILGSMPGAESLRQQQYYAFRRNVFWRIMGSYFHFPVQAPYPERLLSMQQNHAALWDVLSGCRRKGSLDSEIESGIPNDIPGFLAANPSIRLILCNGGASFRFLHRFFPEVTALKMPSTSPAAAMFSYEEKCKLWHEALDRAFMRG